MQQPVPSLPAEPSQSIVLFGASPQGVDAADLDLGYEGAFPFLTEDRAADTGQRC